MKQNYWKSDANNLFNLYRESNESNTIQNYMIEDSFESGGFKFNTGMTIAGYIVEEDGKKSLVLTDDNNKEYGRIDWNDKISIFKPTNTNIGGVIAEAHCASANEAHCTSEDAKKDSKLILSVVNNEVSEALDKIGMSEEAKHATKNLIEKALRAGVVDEGVLGQLSEGVGKGFFQGTGGAILGGMAGSAVDAATGGATGGLGRQIGTAVGGGAGLMHGLKN